MKVYKKFVLFLAKAYLFFRVLRKKPKYILGFLGIPVGVAACLVLLVIAIHAMTAGKSGTAAEAAQGDPDRIGQASELSGSEAGEESAVSGKEDDLWYGTFDPDLEAYQEINSDVIGWIYFENADISYPILYSGDDSTYLRMTYDGQSSTSGSIFLEGQDSPDFSDRHMLIYGHNMKDKTMFGQLKNYKTDPDYYADHAYFQLIYRDEESKELVKQRYRIFACKDVSTTDAVYTVLDENYNGLATFASDTLCSGNYLADVGDIAVTDLDRIITLSTCSSDDDRFVVSAICTQECRLNTDLSEQNQ